MDRRDFFSTSCFAALGFLTGAAARGEAAQGTADAARKPWRVGVLTGSTDSSTRRAGDFSFLGRDDVRFTVYPNVMGPNTASGWSHAAFGEPGLVVRAVQAQREGMDALVIESGGDTALKPCREVCSIPVTGMMDTAMRLAGVTGRRFGVITAGAWHARAIEDLATLYGCRASLAGMTPLGMEPAMLFQEARTSPRILQALADAALRLESLGADTVLFGGSYFLGLAPSLRQALLEQGADLVVLDSLELAARLAILLAEAGVSHSKRVHPAPSPAPLTGYGDLSTTPSLAPLP